MDRFHYLQKGLSAVLTFIGVKMLIVYFDIHVPTWLSMVVVFGILGLAIGASLLRKPTDGKEMT